MTESIDTASSPLQRANYIAGLAGALAGGVLGYYAFVWLVKQGFYALALPGALVGFGCGRLSGGHSRLLGITCAVAALPLGIYSEWSTFPFVADDSLDFFLRNLSKLKPVTWIMIALGMAFGYWLGQGRDHFGDGVRPGASEPASRND